MAVRIVVDSAADYETKELEERGIERVSMPICFGEEDYRDGITLSKSLFYEKLLERKCFPKTSQPSPQDFFELFSEIIKAGDSAVVILVSAALSGTCQSANIAREMCDAPERIHIIDSNTVASAIRLLADEAVRLRAAGRSCGEIVEQIEQLKKRVRIIAAVDTLEFLAKGGRISKLTAEIGNLANLKPLVTVSEEGLVSMWGKALGKAKACCTLYKQMIADEPDFGFPVIMVYSHDMDNCERMYEKLHSLGIPVSRENAVEIGPTIGTHVGDGAFGVAYVKRK